MKRCRERSVRRIGLAAAGAIVAAWVLGVTGSHAAGPPSAEVHVVLKGALPKPSADGETDAADLELTLFCEDSQWANDVYGFAPEYDLSFHEGELRRVAVNEDRIHLAVRLTVRRGATLYGLARAPDGVGEYEIDLKRDGDDRLAGAFSGTVAEVVRAGATGGPKSVQGKAQGRLAPFWPRPVRGHVPVEPGEHPRLFFRKSDVPAIRRRADTPLGRKIVAHMQKLLARDKGGFGWNRDGSRAWPYTDGAQAAGHAFMYVLTGEAAHAERAKLITLLAMCRNHGEWGGWGNGLRVPGVAAAYDLCYDAWDEAFRRDVVGWLEASALGRGASVDAHFEAMFQAGGGLAALAILDDPVPPPPKPRLPSEAVVLDPPKDFHPAPFRQAQPEPAEKPESPKPGEGTGLEASAGAEGVPIAPFQGGRMPTDWLVAGAFQRAEGEDPLAAIGGCGGARPEAGTKVIHRGLEYEFRHKSSNFGLYKFNPGRLLKDRPDRSSLTYAYFYAALENEGPRTVLAIPNAWGAMVGPPKPLFGVRMWLAGRELRNGDVVRLKAGKYPLLIEVALTGTMFVKPRLLDYTEEVYREALAKWETEHEAYQAAGRTPPHARPRLRKMVHFLRLYLGWGMGDRAFPWEGSNWTDGWHNLLPFAQAYRNVMGRDLAEGTGLEWVIPLQMAGSGRFWHCDWGDEFWRTLGFPDVVPEPYKPALRWYMDEGFKDLDNSWGPVSLPWHGMFALLNYPWDVPAGNPRDIGLPLLVQDTRIGGYIFRSGWNEQKDFVTVVMSQRGAARSCVSAGDFSIFGRRGRTRWTGMTTAGGGFFRPACLESVERPSVPRIEGAIPVRGAKTVHFQARPDGSAVVSLLMDHWVKGSSADAHASPKVQDPDNLGIKVLRSIAVDYSGASGAPCLVAVADKIAGAGDREIWEQLNFTRHKGGATGAINVDGRTFKIVPPRNRHEAETALSLTGTFLAPGKVILRADQWTGMLRAYTRVPGKEHAGAERMDRMAADRKGGEDGRSGAAQELAQTGNEEENKRPARRDAKPAVFFMVLTIQDGPAPEVKVEGEGLNARATVGNQTVSFDGEKVVLAK